MSIMNHMQVPTSGPFANALIQIDDRILRMGDVHPWVDGEEAVDLWDGPRKVLLRDLETGEATQPTLSLLRKLHTKGRAAFCGAPANAAERQARFATLDPDACADRDPKSIWRHSLASRAIDAGVKMTDAECKAFLDVEYGRREADFKFRKPSPSALRRWMAKLKKLGRTPATLISKAGRPKGSSQLSPEINAIVHQGSLLFYTRAGLMKAQSHAWVRGQVIALNASLPVADHHPVPSKQTVYARIDALRCFETVASKYGKQEALRQFKGSGEALIVNTLLEVVLMDATTLEQTIVFDDDWQLPACKVRIIALMDALSHAIVGFHVYAGPNRAETSIEAVLASMTTPDVDPEALSEMPILACMYGRGRSLLPDNEKALIGPSTIGSFNEIGIDVLLPPIEMPQAKASLERFWRFLKEALALLPGTILDPRRAEEMGYDPVGPTLTMPQLRKMVTMAVTEHNISPSKGLGGKSPAHVWMLHADKRATPIFEDLAYVRRMLGKTQEALLTRDGVEINGIRYRDAALVKGLLDDMAGSAPAKSRRKDGSHTIKVKARISPGNIDTVQIYNTLAEQYVSLPSTQPRYTANLSEWEHKEFTRQAKRRGEKFSSEEHRLRAKARTMKIVDEMAPQVAFQARRDMATLYQSQQVGKLAARSFPMPAAIAAAAAAPQITFGEARADTGLPAKSTRKADARGNGRPKAPKRPEIDLGDGPLSIDWDGLRLPADNDDNLQGRGSGVLDGLGDAA
jgi:putative transposase